MNARKCPLTACSSVGRSYAQRGDPSFAFAARFYRALDAFPGDRLRVTTARFGYGSSPETEDAAFPNRI